MAAEEGAQPGHEGDLGAWLLGGAGGAVRRMLAAGGGGVGGGGGGGGGGDADYGGGIGSVGVGVK